MKPWLWLPPKIAHDLSPFALKLIGHTRPPRSYPWDSFAWRGLHFANRLGIAGGVDKNASMVQGWWSLGAGFIEIGTVTPKPQSPNPGLIIDRDPATLTLWNKMGFPSVGAAVVEKNLRRLPAPRQTPLFVNIGKNRQTPNEEAATDYVSCLQTLSGFADAFVINISSPNTQGLRDLQGAASLENLLSKVMHAREKSRAPQTPLLLKLSPDLSTTDLHTALDVSHALNLEGWILTNTTFSREPGSRFPKEGGVSGRPLSGLSKETLKNALKHLGSRRDGKLVISAGGILTPEDVFERLELGADLTQVYTALIFQGPGFFKQVAKAYPKRLL